MSDVMNSEASNMQRALLNPEERSPELNYVTAKPFNGPFSADAVLEGHHIRGVFSDLHAGYPSPEFGNQSQHSNDTALAAPLPGTSLSAPEKHRLFLERTPTVTSAEGSRLKDFSKELIAAG